MAEGVLLVGPVPPPPGGIATHVRELASALSASGARVTVVDPRRDGPRGRDGRPRLLLALAGARARGDVVHVHANGHNRGSWLLAALGSAGQPAILTLHSGLAPAYLRAHASRCRRIADRYAFVVAVNAEIAAALAGAGLPAERVVVAPAFSPSALGLCLAPPGLRAIRRRHAALACAMLAPGPEYGADVLLDAFAQVHAARPEAGLVVYGPGTRDPALFAAACARRLRDAAYFLGPLGRERALAVVTASDLFVRPTRADGDAVSVREALALGRPVVASAVGARPPEAHLFRPGDAAACAEALFRVLGTAGAPRAPASAPAPDGLPAILALYRRCGLATTGTALAT